MALSKKQERLLSLLKQVALEIGDAGRSLTDIIGELSTCKLLGLTWKPSEGYDALGPSRTQFQIKTRKSWSTAQVNPKGRIGRFGKKDKYDFDQGLYVELDKTFEVQTILLMSKEVIIALESKKTKKRGLHVSEVRRYGKKVYP
jgi:hypothetical protein